MSVSALPAVTDALVSVFTAALAVPVFDGPPAMRPTDSQFVMVGATELPGDGDNGELLESTTSRSLMGNGEFVDESGSVTCSVLAWSGDTSTMSALRRDALALVDASRGAIEADPSLGVLPFGYFAEVGSARLRQEQTQNGIQVRVTFTVTYQTLLTP